MKKTGFQLCTQIITLAVLAFFLLGAGSRVIADEPAHYRFGVFPFMPMAALIKYYNAVSMDFTQIVNKRVIAQSRPTFKLFSEEIEKETYDIIFIQPFDYPKAYRHGYRPLARRSDNLDAIIVTKIDSNIKSIKDLTGKIIANPPMESAISLVIRKELKKAGINGDNIEMIYTGNHFACMQMVLVGKADACSTTSPVLQRWETTELKTKKLQVIHQASGVPHALYMAHQRMPDSHQQKFKQAILSWNERPQGRMILKTFAVSSFVEAKDEEYDIIRSYFY